MSGLEVRGRRTVFFHVMKTGGMTFRHMLSSIYGEKYRVCDDPAIDAVAADLARYECVEFHVQPSGTDWVYLHSELVREQRWDLLEGRDIFVMFRKPVDQMLSMYFFLVKIRAIAEPELRASGLTFPESLEEFLDHRQYFNNQLGFMVGKTQRWALDLDRNDLANAKDMLVRLRAHVGLTERFNESAGVFAAVTGHRVPEKIVNHNENRERPRSGAISPKVIDRIREQSALDLELYMFAQEMFQEDLAAYAPTRSYSFASSLGAADTLIPTAMADATVEETSVTSAEPFGRVSWWAQFWQNVRSR